MYLFSNNQLIRSLFICSLAILTISVSFSQDSKIINDFAPKELINTYKEYNKENKELIFVYVDLNNCYNCSQGLRWIAKADNSPNYKVYYLIEGISQKKISILKKEYGLKNNICLLKEGTWVAQFLKRTKEKENTNTSIVLFMSSEYCYSRMALTALNSLYSKNITPKNILDINDSLYYTSFNNLTYFNKSFYSLLAPKNSLLKIDKQLKISESINFDSFYFHPIMIESFYSGMPEDLKKCNSLSEIANNYNTIIKEQGYSKGSAINFQVTENNLIIYVIFYYPLWKDTAKSTISLRPFPAIVYLNKFNTYSLFRPLNISNSSKDSFYYDYSNLLIQKNDSIRIAVLRGDKYVPNEYYPLDATLIWDKITSKFKFGSYGKRYRITFKQFDTSKYNNYLLACKEDELKNKLFKSHNSLINYKQSTIKKIGNFDELFSDSLYKNYYIYCASALNDSVTNFVAFIRGNPIVFRINTNNATLLNYFTLKTNKNTNLNNPNSFYLNKNNLYVVCYDNNLESDILPQILTYIIPEF